MRKHWPRSLLASAAVSLACMLGAPAAAQLPGQTLPSPQNSAEQHITDMSNQADQALENAKAAADHCNPDGIAAAIDQLQNLEQQSRQAMGTARLSGSNSLVRPDFAKDIHRHIAGTLQTARALKAFCPQNQTKPAQNAPPPPKPPVPPPQPPPTTPQAAGGPTQPPPPPPPPPVSAEEFIAGAEDEAEDAFDDYVDAALHCDAKGMQDALDYLEQLEAQAEQIRDAARMAGKFSRIKASDADDVYQDIHAMVLDALKVKMRCPLLPQPRPSASPPCPPSKPEQPRTGGTSKTSAPLPGSTAMMRVPDDRLDSFARPMLSYQNELRSYVGMPPLHWNSVLAAHAMDYATTLSQTGELQHSSRQGRETERENIVVGPRGSGSPMSMAQIWGKELQYFHPGKFPNACIGDWSRCGHITQILWGRTTDVGCGFAAGRYDALVCRYSPPGNADSKYVLQLPRGWPCDEQLPSAEAYRPERGR
jgi:Cysteine-rich secretory protein family